MNKKLNSRPAPDPVENLTNREFNNWTVKSYARYEKRHIWNVVCVCGKTGEVGEYQLINNLSKSCGCHVAEHNRRLKTTHGESINGKRSPELRAYQLAKGQCQNPRHENYEKFGGAGIEFKFDTFSDFLKEVGRKPGIGYVLTRKLQSGHYEPGNLEWTKNKNRHMSYNLDKIKELVETSNPPLVGFTVRPAFWAHVKNDLPEVTDAVRQTFYNLPVWILPRQVEMFRSWKNMEALKRHVAEMEG